MRAHRFEQCIHAHCVVVPIFRGLSDAFTDGDECGKMHDEVDSLFLEDLVKIGAAPQVSFNKNALLHGGSVALRKVVEHEVGLARLAQQLAHMRANVAGPPDDQDHLLILYNCFNFTTCPA